MVLTNHTMRAISRKKKIRIPQTIKIIFTFVGSIGNFASLFKKFCF